MFQPNRYVYLLVDTLFNEDLHRQLDLLKVPAYLEYIGQQKKPLAEFKPKYFATSATLDGT